MNNISTLEFVSELNAMFKCNNNGRGLSIFLGAGADVSSGGVLFSDLKKEVVAYIRGNSIHEFESNSVIDKEFNEAMEQLTDESRSMVIEYFIKNSQQWLPSDGYKLLILMAKEGYISSVITTNFADLLETTQSIMGVDAFYVFSPATAIPADYFINYKSPKAIYLKMHGDIEGRLISHLTQKEIQTKPYQKEFTKLFSHLIKNETLVFLGYSGWDVKIANIFNDNISNIESVYWCNVKNPDEQAPLIKVFRDHNVNIKYVNCNFDAALQTMATELFKERAIFQTDSIFIWALIKVKIAKLQKEFIKNLESDTYAPFIITRTKLNTLDDFMINTEKNLCAVTGDSAVGKSILMEQFCDKYKSNDEIYPIPLNMMTTYSVNLLDYIVKKLGYISKDAFTVLFQFSRWAKEQHKTFVFVIDNIGNDVGTAKEIALLLNAIIELAYIIRTHKSIKFIVTLSTSTWNSVFQLLDSNYLNSVIWNDQGEDVISSVRLGSFDEYELSRAQNKLLSVQNTTAVPADLTDLIREPYLYGIIQKNVYLLQDDTGLNVYKIFERTFFNGRSKIILEKMANIILSRYIKLNVSPKLSQETIDYLKENESLKSILCTEQETLDFKNDLVFECCLASHLNSNHYIDDFIQDYKLFEEEYLINRIPQRIYNGLIRYCGIVCKDFGKIVKLIYRLLRLYNSPSPDITKFVNDVFAYMAQYNIEQYVHNIQNFNTKSDEFTELLKFFIHSIGFMKDIYAFPLLSYLMNVSNSSHKLECISFINDRFSIGLRKSSTLQKNAEYFESYIRYILIPDRPLKSIFSLLWVMGRVGKDNVSYEIYNSTSYHITNKINSLKGEFSYAEINEIKDIFLKNAYFIFFNADDNLEEKYASYPQKSKLIPIISRVEKKEDLTVDDLHTISSLVDHFDETIEFFTCNMIFIYMATYNLDYALKNLDALYNTFTENTTVLELDFYSSALFLACYVADPVNRQPYLERKDKLINDFEMKMFISPSMERMSSCRKFTDKFDIEFEDGFNILTDYTYTAPMDNYIQKSHKHSVDIYLSLLWKLLDRLDQNGMYDEMLRIIQAINQMSVSWPEEALEALSKFSKYNHPVVRKAIIRTLAENYLRYPGITIRYLTQTGDAFTDDESLQIFSATDSQIENHALEQLQWGRIIYFVYKYLNSQIIDDIFTTLKTSDTLYEVFSKLIHSILC